jgi:hypothetical protein
MQGRKACERLRDPPNTAKKCNTHGGCDAVPRAIVVCWIVGKNACHEWHHVLVRASTMLSSVRAGWCGAFQSMALVLFVNCELNKPPHVGRDRL